MLVYVLTSLQLVNAYSVLIRYLFIQYAYYCVKWLSATFIHACLSYLLRYAAFRCSLTMYIVSISRKYMEMWNYELLGA